MNDIVIFNAVIEREVYNSDNFKVYAVAPTTQRDKLVYNKYGNVSICGNIQELSLGMTYTITGKLNKKDGYDVMTIKTPKPKTLEESQRFLYEVITERQADLLLEQYPNIIDMIINDEPVDLSKVKGIKDKTFAKIKAKVEDNFVLMEFIEEFSNYDLTLSMARKLRNKYKTIPRMRKAFTEDPYTALCSISGIGFKKADTLILSNNNNKHLVKSKMRAKACVDYLLGENLNNGNTWIDMTELHKQFYELAYEAEDYLLEVLSDDKVYYYNKEDNRVSFMYIFLKEVFIANTINNMLEKPITWNIDFSKYINVNGFDLSKEQQQALPMVLNNNIGALIGSAGCVDCDTEFFNGTKWKRIADYKEEDKVLQYNEDGTAELVYPERYIKQIKNQLWHFKTKYGVNQCLSDNHMVVYKTSKGNLYKKPFSEVKKCHENTSSGFSGKFYTTFQYDNIGIDLSDDEIKLMCAVICDGYFPKDRTDNMCYVNLKKDRKKIELESLLNKLKIDFKIHKGAEGYKRYLFKAPRREKEFTPSYWYNCNNHQLKIISENILQWDGCIQGSKRTFSTCNKINADFIQFVFSSQGMKCRILEYDRVGQIRKSKDGKEYTRKSIEYTLTISNRNMISIGGFHGDNPNKTVIEPYKTKDGYEYCFTVPSHMLVLRREGCIFITGNCGKSCTVEAVVNMLKDNDKRFLLLTPTGKASTVYENIEASTVHRGLGYNPQFEENPWTYNCDNKLKDIDVVFVDEVGMLGVDLLNVILNVIDITKTKLFFIGDASQLPSVNYGNVLHDIINSKTIPITELTTVFRVKNGKESGILSVSENIRHGVKFVKEIFEMQQIGSDFMFIPSSDDYIMTYIKNLYKQCLQRYKPEDIVILVPSKKGNICTVTINEMIQKTFNPYRDGVYSVKSGERTYREGDVIMQVRNNYRIEDEDGSENMVFNGESGFIKKINYNNVIAEYKSKTLVYSKDSLSELELGYSMTIHKSQGSGYKCVIVALPRANTFILNKNILYTAITRAKESCFLIGLPSTINSCINRSAELNRNTWLLDLLKILNIKK